MVGNKNTFRAKSFARKTFFATTRYIFLMSGQQKHVSRKTFFATPPYI
jgi:hypothetical protein